MIKKMLLSVVVAFVAMTTAYACFDTYLFLNKRSMVYPERHFIMDTLSEYSFNNMRSPAEDTFFMDFNAYYGVTKRFSIQVGAASAEITRDELLKIDEYGLKGVYNIVKMKEKSYYLDTILACRSSVGGDVAFEISAPNIFYKGDNVFVLHPVIELPKNSPAIIGGHCGIFHTFKDVALIGIGAEYASAQSGSTFNKRLVKGEAATSLFFGARLGNIFYFQNEFAKGLANSRDFGFAATLKIFVK